MSKQAQSLPLAVCAAVIEQEGRILLTERPADKQLGGYWEFPGGKLEPGESPQQALIREIREELGIEIEVGPVLETVYHHYPRGSVLIFAYLCHWRSGELKHLEVSDHAWLRPEQFAHYNILPADQPILNRLIERSQQPG